MHIRVLRLVLSGLMGALLVVSKQAMSGLPNIEPVTLLVILFALELPRETPGAVTVFILLQGVLYGFGLWWAMYLYVWYLLALLAWLLRRMDNALGWAVFSGIYGLCFGGLCAAVYLVAKTPAFALSWWLSGLSYDAMHGVGNFVIMLLLYRPLRRALLPIGMLIGYYIVKAEPAVQVLNEQVEEITGGTISRHAMNRALQAGVAVAVALAMLRVLTGLSIYWVLIPGYAAALIMSRFVPPVFVGIAFDSGGVASGPMTSTFLLPLAMGACSAVGGNVVTDAFGIVALVALAPLIAIQIMGLLYARRTQAQTAPNLLDDTVVELEEY